MWFRLLLWPLALAFGADMGGVSLAHPHESGVLGKQRTNS